MERECARGIFYKPADIPHNDPPTYRPMIVGEDFLCKTDCVIDLRRN
jgi:hypothetical protein